MQPRDHKAPLQGIITCTTPENADGKIKTLQGIIKQLGPWRMKQQLAHKISSKHKLIRKTKTKHGRANTGTCIRAHAGHK